MTILAAFAAGPCLGLRVGLPSFIGSGSVSSGRPWLRFASSAQTICSSAASPESPAPRRMPAVVRPLVPSRELQAFVPDKVAPRSAVLKALSAYVKENNLQDPKNRTVVRCDSALESLLGVDTCTILEMSKYVTPHLSKPEDVGGKYIAEAKQYEEAWTAENGHKPTKRAAKKRKAPAKDAQNKGKGLWRPVQLSPDLAMICGNRSEMPRQEIIKAVWAYIRLNNLQEGPGKPVRCDFLLRKVFDRDTITSRDIMGGISKHVIKK